MCASCHPFASRRGFLAMTVGALAGALTSAPIAYAAEGSKTDLTPDQALARLKSGNDRFVAAPELCAAKLNENRGKVAGGQAPWATIVGCADSRVPPELLFGGVGLGELFVARNAGNMVDTATLGTIEYGAAALGVPLIVVLGHSACGAVAAAVDMANKKSSLPGSMDPMVRAILPAVEAASSKPGDPILNAVRESAVRTAASLSGRSAIVGDLVRAGKVRIAAACYDLASGKVEFLA
jgi:carbonic anhydrase